MKIERVRSQIVRLPADEPLADGKPFPGATRDIVVVKITTRDGIDGLGVTFFGAALTGALKAAIDALGALIVGDDPIETERIAEKLRTAAGGSAGPSGIYTLAVSAIDTALWDIRGRRSASPLPGCSAASVIVCRPTPAARSCARSPSTRWWGPPAVWSSAAGRP
jgi:L-alanine-DL-glutamate epimerase-like enolase superfamily enzyme